MKRVSCVLVGLLFAGNSLAAEVAAVERNGSYQGHTKYRVSCTSGYETDLYYNPDNRCWMKTSSWSCDFSVDPDALQKSARLLCGNH